MKNTLVYNITNENDYNLIIEPGYYHYEFKSNQDVKINFMQIGDIELKQEDVHIEFNNETITLTINKLGVSCNVLIKSNDAIVHEFSLL